MEPNKNKYMFLKLFFLCVCVRFVEKEKVFLYSIVAEISKH